MRIDYPKIKKFLHIGIFSFDLLIFMIVLFSTSSSSKTYKEYTGSSKFFLDLYIIIIYAVLITISIFPKLLYFRLRKYILFIFDDKGKVIISFLISLIYWFAANKPQFVLGVILTLTSTLLLIYEFIFYFTKVETFLSGKGITFDNKGKPTFDIETFEKDEKNNAPLSGSQNPNIPNVNNSDDMGNKQDSNYGKDNNSSNVPDARDVEVKSGYEKQSEPNNQQGFGF